MPFSGQLHSGEDGGPQLNLNTLHVVLHAAYATGPCLDSPVKTGRSTHVLGELSHWQRLTIHNMLHHTNVTSGCVRDLLALPLAISQRQSSMLPALHFRSQPRQCVAPCSSSNHLFAISRRCYVVTQPVCSKLRAICRAAADASILQESTEPSPVPDAEQQHKTQLTDAADQQAQQAQQTQQQQQDGLLGPLTTPAAGDHALEVDRVVERELLDSNGAWRHQ